jgi:hypothetical protein
LAKRKKSFGGVQTADDYRLLRRYRLKNHVLLICQAHLGVHDWTDGFNFALKGLKTIFSED